MNEKLSRFAEILSASKELREVKIETTLTPRWNFIVTASMGRLLTSLPLNSTTLTLDTHACHFKLRHVHMCAIISQRLDSFQTVRIRMRSICPSILETCINSPNTASRLRTLVIRLYLPDHTRMCHSAFNAKSCYPSEKRICREMTLAGLELAKARPSMTGVRIAFRRHGPKSIVVADCKMEAAFWYSESINYKDGALVEGPWEDSVELWRRRISFTQLLPT